MTEGTAAEWLLPSHAPQESWDCSLPLPLLQFRDGHAMYFWHAQAQCPVFILRQVHVPWCRAGEGVCKPISLLLFQAEAGRGGSAPVFAVMRVLERQGAIFSFESVLSYNFS